MAGCPVPSEYLSGGKEVERGPAGLEASDL